MAGEPAHTPRLAADSSPAGRRDTATAQSPRSSPGWPGRSALGAVCETRTQSRWRAPSSQRTTFWASRQSEDGNVPRQTGNGTASVAPCSGRIARRGCRRGWSAYCRSPGVPAPRRTRPGRGPWAARARRESPPGQRKGSLLPLPDDKPREGRGGNMSSRAWFNHSA